ncbi:diaminopimelate epimerase [bacterium]|nr:diaminopimelate epimerase [bacterium]
MHLDFEKWHGCKNDFVVTWIQRSDKDLVVPSLQRQAARVCDRTGAGIGADGILVLVTRDRRENHPEELIVINQDGSLARNCGNGLRCAARSALRKFAATGTAERDMPPAIELLVQGRAFHCKVFKASSVKGMIGVDMGDAEVEEILPSHPAWRAADAAFGGQGARTIHKVDVGNPHLVLLGFAMDARKLSAFAESVQTLDGWDGINVHVAEETVPDDRETMSAAKGMSIEIEQSWRAIPWERGVGLTQACGSGAVAIAAAVLARDDMGENGIWTVIRMPGGQLFVQNAEKHFILAGPAELVYTGSVEI